MQIKNKFMRRAVVLSALTFSGAASAQTYTSAQDHLRLLGAGRDFNVLAAGLPDDVFVFDRNNIPPFADARTRTLIKNSRSQLADFTLHNSDGSGPCHIYSVTRAQGLLEFMSNDINVPFESPERFDAREIALWTFQHELAHCKQVEIASQRRLREAQADIAGIKKIRAINPGTNIAQFIIAYRTLDSVYRNELWIEAILNDKPLPPEGDMLKALGQMTASVTNLRDRYNTMLTSPAARGLNTRERNFFGVLAAYDGVATDGNNAALVRDWARLKRDAMIFLMPRTSARILAVSRAMPHMTAPNPVQDGVYAVKPEAPLAPPRESTARPVSPNVFRNLFD